MKIKRGNLLTVLLSVLCAVILVCTLGMFSGKNSRVVSAASGNMPIGELTANNYNSNTKAIFNGNNLKALYCALTGNTTNNAILSDVEALGTLNAAGIKQKSGVNVSVMFGGYIWDVVYLTKSGNDVVLTLWMNGTVGSSAFGWAGSAYAYGEYSLNDSGKIANAYGTSQIRALGLNGGGTSGASSYYTDATTSVTVNESTRKTHALAKFTLDKSVIGGTSLTDYLVAPSAISYVYNLSRWSLEGLFANNLNDALGGGGNNTYGGSGSKNIGNGSDGSHKQGWWNQGFYNYANSGATNGYDDWGSDLIWIPALSETGYTNANTREGVWGTAGNGINTHVASDQWLRSGVPSNPYQVSNLSSSGGPEDVSAATSFAVRPALHLNLSKADESIVLEAEDFSTTTAYGGGSKTITYTGSQQTLSYLKPDWYTKSSEYFSDSSKVEYTYEFIEQGDTISAFSVPTLGDDGITQSLKVDPTNSTDLINAGRYKITIKLLDDGLGWSDDTLDYATATNDAKDLARYKVVYFTITQAEIKYKWKNIGLDNNWKVEYAQSFTPSSGASAAPWVYLDYTLLTTADNAATPSATTTKIPYVVLKFTGTDSQFGDSVIQDIDNVRGGTTKGTDYPKHADNYVVSFADKNKDTSNYKLVPDTDTNETSTRTYSITRKKVTAPGDMTAKEYSGSAQTFTNLTGYDNTYMTYGTLDASSAYQQGALPSNGQGNDLFTLAANGNSISLTATEVNKYRLHYRLLTQTNASGVEVVRDYMWSNANVSDPAPVIYVDYQIKCKTLEFAFVSTADGGSWTIKANDETSKLNYSYAAGKGPVTGDTPVLEIWYYFNNDGAESSAVYDDSTTDLLFGDLKNLAGNHTTGTYTVEIRLANSTANPVNANYVIENNNTRAITLTAAEASLDDIKTVYKSSTMGASDDPEELPASPNNLTYEYDENNKTAVTYVFTLDFTDINFLQTTGSYTYKYSDGTSAPNGFNKADTVTVTVNIEVKAEERANNKLPAQSEYTGTKFTYMRIDDYTGTLSYTYTIGKKATDLSDVSFEYTTDGGTNWTEYNSSNPPEADGATTYFEVRVPLTALTNLGVTGMPTVSNYGNQFGPGDVTFDLDFTFDSNHKAMSGQNEHQMSYTMQTTGKKLAVKWNRVQLTDSNGDPVKDVHGMPYFVYELDTSNLPTDALQYIKYEYYTDNGGVIGNQITGGSDVEKHKNFTFITDPTGMDANSQNPKQVFVKVVLDGVPMMGPANNVPQYVFDTTTDPVDKRITVGDNRKAVDVTAGTVTSMTYGSSVNIADAYEVAINNPHVKLQPNQYTVALYLGNMQINADATAQDYSQLNAGKYTLKFTLDSSMDAQYALTSDSLDFEIKPKEITVPTLKAGVTFTFNGLDQQLETQLDGLDANYMEWDLSSVHEAYHASTYTAVIKIKDAYAGNYVFNLPATQSTTKHPVKALVDGETLPNLSGDKTTAMLPWTIEKYVYDTTTKNAWDFTKDGASLNFSGVPTSIKALTMGNDPTLVFGVVYYDLDGNPLTDVELKGGNKFQVAAYLDPNCADANDIEFKGQTYDPMTSLNTSPQASYTVPKSGASAFMDKVKDAMTKVYFGLPLWAWLLIALALIILLIIIIVVAKKRHKTKEEREEKKALKEEEKARKEEERQRREEEREAERQRREDERRMQQEKLEAERELARAKQEAELEKIRAQAQAGTAGAGMATMAMAQQQPQQQIPVQTVDNDFLKEMREQMAELRADNKATQAKLAEMQHSQQAPMAQPMMPMQPQYPMYQQPMMPQYGGDPTLARLEAQLNAMQAEQRARYDAEQRIELAAMRAEQHVDRDSRHSVDLAAMREHINGHNYNRIPDYSNATANQQPNSIEALGAIVAAALKNMANGEVAATQVPELPQKAEQEAVAKYPSDAVITTTTTVDTTKSKPITRSRGEEENFDVDGFYDSIDY